MKADNRLDQVLHLIGEHYGITPIVSLCMHCGIVMGVKDGCGTIGLSHGYCPDCLAGQMDEMHINNVCVEEKK